MQSMAKVKWVQHQVNIESRSKGNGQKGEKMATQCTQSGQAN